MCLVVVAGVAAYVALRTVGFLVAVCVVSRVHKLQRLLLAAGNVA
jgi:hypothetical protein